MINAAAFALGLLTPGGLKQDVAASTRWSPHRGTLTVTGVATKPTFYQSADLVFKELTVRGSFIYEQEFDMAIDLLARGVVDVEPLTCGVRDIAPGRNGA